MNDTEIENQESLENVFERCDNPSEAWNSRVARKILSSTNADWIFSLRHWSIFITLTFRDERPPDIAKSLFEKLIKSLNENAFGKHYTKIVGHSYFSYVRAMEYQKRDVVHFHVMVDQPVNFERIHTLWNSWAGFAHTDIIKDKNDVVNYVCKYIVKGGEIYPFLAKKEFTPKVLPYWWKLAETKMEGKQDEKTIS